MEMSGRRKSMQHRSYIKILLFFLVFLCTQNFNNIKVNAAENTIQLLELEQPGKDYVYLSWSAAENVNGYTVYRSEDNGKMSAIKDVTDTSTYNYNLINGKDYVYAVRPYIFDKMHEKVYGTFSNSLEIQVGVKTPQKLSAAMQSTISTFLSWNGDELADGYMIYKSEDNVNWSLVKSINETNTVTYGLENGKEYYFRVKAYRTINGKKRYSDYSESVKIIMGIKKPDQLSVNPISSNAVELQWEKVQGASGYRVYRSDNGSEYQLIKTINTSSTRNYSLDSEVNYRYKVAAIRTSGNKTTKSNDSEEVSIRLSLDEMNELIVQQKTQRSVLLSWEKISQANAYRVYRTEDGETKLIKTVSSNETMTYGLEKGKVYRFSVKPVWITENYTLSGQSCESEYFYNNKVSGIHVEQIDISKLKISWSSMANAEEYRIYGINGNDKTYIQSSEKKESIIDIEKKEGQFAITAVCNGIESEETIINNLNYIQDPEESTLSLMPINANQINLFWNPEENAIAYEIKRVSISDNVEKSWLVANQTNYLDFEVTGNETYFYQYRIQYRAGNYEFWGKWLDEKTVTTPDEPEYRALLIGEENYMQILNGPINDIEAMDNVLKGFDKMNWNVYKQADSTKSEILSLIDIAFSGADEDDISLFYYSGHGITGSGKYYSGALMTVDYEYITLKEFAEALSNVPGKIIVILDSCGSGAAVADKDLTTVLTLGSDFDAVEFNEQVIEAFSAYDADTMERSKEFANEKFFVLTASAYEQNSRSVMINNLWGGAFTRGIAGSCGYNYNLQSWNELMSGDADRDDILTLKECYSYAAEFVRKYQNAQVYPENSSFKLFYR